MNRKIKWIIASVLGLWLVVTLVWFGFDLDGKYSWVIGSERVAIPDSTITDTVVVVEEDDYTLYGIDTRDFEVVDGVVEKNQFLHNILNPHGISALQLDDIGRRLKDTFDVRYMKVGKKYLLVLNKDSARSVRYFVYEIDNTDYVVYDFDSTLKAYRGRKPIVTETRETGGVINSSLYLTLDEQNASPTLAIELSEVYAWAVDFYRIQKGDWFKVIYDEKFVDGKSIGVSKIHGAVFNHYNRDYYAIWFDYAEQEGDYFDQNNNCCRATFLKAPVKFSRISSRYSLSRKHPVTGVVKGHFGTDYAAPYGTPIVSTANGVVLEAMFSKYNGNYVKIKHNSMYTTQYLHMQKIATGMRPGVRVQQGQVIGYVGSTGLATGPHVCYRFWLNGKQVDALRVEMPPAEPVKEEYKEEYEKVKKAMMERLDAIKVPGVEQIASK
ncbi:peptidoglycan DD-metalloendopeptidase family protein [bacterium]|nr:peptidoglycan DD-metalloendopeptidase family protein [bacterium]